MSPRAPPIWRRRARFIQKLETNRRKQALAGRDVVSQQAAEEAVCDEAVAKADVSVAESEVESVKAQLTDARAQLQYEGTMLRHRTLVAPFDAVVIERHKETGSVIKAGDPIFTLIAVGSYWGLAHVDEARAVSIEEGQPVEARMRSRPLESFTGRVVRIGLESDRVTEERCIYLRGENPPVRVYLGEQVEFWITAATLWFGHDWETALYRAATMLVAASPCAIVISVPAAILAALSAAARGGDLFKGGGGQERSFGLIVEPSAPYVRSVVTNRKKHMAQRSGSADLPLHGGRVPAWLGQRMAALGAVITQAIVQHYGRDEFLRRLAHPFWFQSFGAVMGMDWHSSGITTSVIGALKRGLAPLEAELGIHVCGGRGRHSRRTPEELMSLAERIGFDGAALTQASRLVAKVDSAAVQDGFDLYLHGFFVTDDGRWTVVQQGMNGDKRQARRYHWHSGDVADFVDAPHSAIDGPAQGEIINLTDRRAACSRTTQLSLLTDLGPNRIVDEYAALLDGQAAQPALPHLVMPAHHDVRSSDVFIRRLHGTLAAAAERGPVDFPDLLLTPGVGARTVQSLAMVAEVIHGAPCRFQDPARFSLAHGGKDRHPYPVPIKVYDETIRVLKSAVQKAKLGREEELGVLKRLDAQARRLERDAGAPSFDAFLARERTASRLLGGRSVFGWEESLATEKGADFE